MFQNLGPLELFTILGLLILLILFVLPFWFIFKKAGFPGALGILMIVPLVNIVVLCYLAFAPWPSLQKKKEE